MSFSLVKYYFYPSVGGRGPGRTPRWGGLLVVFVVWAIVVPIILVEAEQLIKAATTQPTDEKLPIIGS